MRELLIIKTNDSKKIKSLLDQNQANYEIVWKEVITPVSKKSDQTSTKKFTFPPEKEIERVLKRIEQPGYRRVNIGLTPSFQWIRQN